uniref:Fibrinogen C-terminal domain-containing protein n=1 Tax=Macrostomum lignano TaxID=282301 RepID=A0A1I8JB79_9PLAT
MVLLYFCCRRRRHYKEMEPGTQQHSNSSKHLQQQDSPTESSLQQPGRYHMASDGKPYALVPPHPSMSADNVTCISGSRRSSSLVTSAAVVSRLRSPATESTWELLARLSRRGEAASSPLCGAATIRWTRQHQTQRSSTIRKIIQTTIEKVTMSLLWLLLLLAPHSVINSCGKRFRSLDTTIDCLPDALAVAQTPGMPDSLSCLVHVSGMAELNCDLCVIQYRRYGRRQCKAFALQDVCARVFPNASLSRFPFLLCHTYLDSAALALRQLFDGVWIPGVRADQGLRNLICRNGVQTNFAGENVVYDYVGAPPRLNGQNSFLNLVPASDFHWTGGLAWLYRIKRVPQSQPYLDFYNCDNGAMGASTWEWDGPGTLFFDSYGRLKPLVRVETRANRRLVVETREQWVDLGVSVSNLSGNAFMYYNRSFLDRAFFNYSRRAYLGAPARRCIRFGSSNSANSFWFRGQVKLIAVANSYRSADQINWLFDLRSARSRPANRQHRRLRLLRLRRQLRQPLEGRAEPEDSPVIAQSLSGTLQPSCTNDDAIDERRPDAEGEKRCPDGQLSSSCGGAAHHRHDRAGTGSDIQEAGNSGHSESAKPDGGNSDAAGEFCGQFGAAHGGAPGHYGKCGLWRQRIRSRSVGEEFGQHLNSESAAVNTQNQRDRATVVATAVLMAPESDQLRQAGSASKQQGGGTQARPDAVHEGRNCEWRSSGLIRAAPNPERPIGCRTPDRTGRLGTASQTQLAVAAAQVTRRLRTCPDRQVGSRRPADRASRAEALRLATQTPAGNLMEAAATTESLGRHARLCRRQVGRASGGSLRRRCRLRRRHCGKSSPALQLRSGRSRTARNHADAKTAMQTKRRFSGRNGSMNGTVAVAEYDEVSGVGALDAGSQRQRWLRRRKQDRKGQFCSLIQNESMDLLSITVGLLAVLAVGWLISYMSGQRRLPPGPPVVPVLGSFPFMKFPLRNWLRQAKQRYGAVCSFQLNGRQVVFLNTYEAVKEAFVTQGALFSGRPRHIFSTRVMGNSGLVMTDGPSWKRHRRFSLQVLRDCGFGKIGSEDSIVKEALELAAALEETRGQPVSTGNPFGKAVSNVICMLVFGRRLATEDPTFDEKLALINKITQQGVSHPTLRSSVLVPLLTSLAPNFLMSMEAVKKSVKLFDEMFTFCQDEIEKKRSAYNLSDEPADYIEAYLAERNRIEQRDPSEAA